MACENNVCGTGGWKGPLPGDPDNFISLTAIGTFGGIDVTWTYPSTNPFAVAFAMVFRGTNENFNDAIRIGNDTDGFYHDKVLPGIEYYYWIQVVSTNGTIAEPIGPDSAEAKSRAEGTLEDLTGRIDESLLGQTLKTRIDGITLNNQAIYKEIQDRINSNQALQDALAALEGEVGEAQTYILNEISARTDADGAIVEQLNVIAAGLDDAKAAIVEIRSVSVTANEALASTLLLMTARIDDNEGSIIEERDIRVTQNEAIIEDYQALYGRVGDSEGAILNIQNLTIDESSALATKLETLRVNAEGAAAAVQSLDTALSNGTHALASSFKTIEAAINGNVATGQIGLIAEIDTITGALTSMYTAKVQVNGLIGGFGIYNNGQQVLAGFDVDAFFIGRTGPDAKKPFIIADDVVYMDDVMIRTASIDYLKIKGDAVTVPVAATTVNNRKPGQGEGVRIKVNTVRMNMEQSGVAYILATAAQGFLKNDRFWSFEIEVINSEYANVKRSVMGRQAESAPVLATTIHIPAGVTTVNLLWQAHPDVLLGDCELFMMGVKR
jgi:hypothetical protein